MGKRKRAKGHRGVLRLYAEVLGLEHLHYGLWDGDPFNLDGLKAAQQRYTEHLTSQIGSGVRSILDCGCGIGTTALMLKQRGYDVEALTPDEAQKKTVEERTGLTCHLARFQDFRPEPAYDLVLMSESCGYIPVEGVEIDQRKLDQIAMVGPRRTYRIESTATIGRLKRRIIAVWDRIPSNQNSRDAANYRQGSWVFWREE